MTHRLPDGSREILSGSLTPDGSMIISLDPKAFSGPSTWGIALVDIAHHVADAAEDMGIPREVALAEIWELFNAEWEKRTDRTRPYPEGGS